MAGSTSPRNGGASIAAGRTCCEEKAKGQTPASFLARKSCKDDHNNMRHVAVTN